MYSSLAIKKAEDFIFGTTANPVKSARGLVIGGGEVYPELKFTLPTMHIGPETFADIRDQYRDIVTGALERAHELGVPGVFIEFETLLEMTLEPKFGVELTKIMSDVCEDYYQRFGLKSELRLTPNDTRDYDRPPKLRSGKYVENMMTLFEEGARAGADFLSIESTGGKEVHDDAILNGDIVSAAFALTVLGTRDMHFLWKRIVDVAKKTGKHAGGDTACGFGNTAMVLAEKRYIPRVFAAVDRVLTVVRTLVAYEEGAVGPDKDCGYEGIYAKAIAGIPISMEGKTAACAHLSPVGNISAAACDLWSNESIQNIKLLGGMAPTVSLEQLAYDTRLMNTALRTGEGRTLQRLFVESDVHTDPQALVLAPAVVLEISAEIVKGKNPIDSGLRGAFKALDVIERAWKDGSLELPDREAAYIDSLREELGTIPLDEGAFTEMMLPRLDTSKVVLSEYGL
jgi:methanol---5-hydroxybenzimidazolylcobamide Co-methyltransferase